MKLTNRRIGLLQAAGLVIYVSLFAITIQQIQGWFMVREIEPGPVLGIILFLLTFIISAIICASMALAYPAFLFFGHRQAAAVKIILWTLTWLIIFFVAFLIICLAILSPGF